ncbi:hypothetical protein, partial [Enterobacter cloacae]|uniref:hypothetical protein n=1 Tax=Enterobacter cloacae TaxID=550 RepID=UPI001CDB1B8A
IFLFMVNSGEQLSVKKQTMSKVLLRPFSGKPGFECCLCQNCHNCNESRCCVMKGRIISG